MMGQKSEKDNRYYIPKLLRLRTYILDALLLKFGLNKDEISKFRNKEEKSQYLLSNYFAKIEGYLTFLEELSYSKINKSLFIKELFKLSNFDKYKLEKEINWTNITFTALLNDIKLENLKSIFRICRIDSYKNKEKYRLILTDESKEPSLDIINSSIKTWNKTNAYKVLVDAKQDKKELIRITIFKEIGVRSFYYFPNREEAKILDRITIYPVRRIIFDLFKENNKWLIICDFKLDKEEIVSYLINSMFQQNVKIKKDLKDDIKRLERKIKSSKDCKSLLSSILDIRKRTLENIKNSNIDKNRKQSLTKIAATISLAGIKVRNQPLLKLDKLDIEGDIEYIQQNEPKLIDSVNRILTSSKDYEVKISLHGKSIGIINGEIKRPLGNLNQNEEEVLNFIFRGNI